MVVRIVLIIIVSIHATLAGGDKSAGLSVRGTLKFLSTPPSRVATAYFDDNDEENTTVSIHATLAGGDFSLWNKLSKTKEFLSTPPSRVATTEFDDLCAGVPVSIHATLAGGDY